MSETNDTRQTARVWEADLGEQGRKLVLEELRALEAMHQCKLLADLVRHSELMVRLLSSLEGRVDRLEQYLTRIDPGRYPGPKEQPRPMALPNGAVGGKGPG